MGKGGIFQEGLSGTCVQNFLSQLKLGLYIWLFCLEFSETSELINLYIYHFKKLFYFSISNSHPGFISIVGHALGVTTMSKSKLYVNALRFKFEIYSAKATLDKNYFKGSIAKTTELYVPFKTSSFLLEVFPLLSSLEN